MRFLGLNRAKRPGSTCKAFLRDAAGATAAVWAIAFPVVIGGISLGTDIGAWYVSEHNLQNATDAAAIAAGYNITGGNPQQGTMLATANKEFTRNGYANGSITVTVNYAPQSGAYAGNTQAVEVIAVQPRNRFFSKLFLNTDPSIRSRAVATRQPTGSACVLALSSSAPQALTFTGSTEVDLNGCSAASNSNASDAIYLSGSSTLNTYSLYTPGGYELGASANLTTSQGAVTNASPLSDPYSSLPTPSFAGCAQTNYSTNTGATLNPGVYCNGMDIKSQANITFNPGIYIIDRGIFKVAGGARITGTDVTIILTSSTGSNYAMADIAGGSHLTLSAPTSDTYAGILFYQDRNAPAAGTNKLNGGSTTNFTGAIYFPKQAVEFTGNNSFVSNGCTKIIADTIIFTGNSFMSTNCPADIATVATQGTVQVVE